MQRYIKYFVHGHGTCSIEDEYYWPSLLTAATDVETLRSDLATLPDCPSEFYLLLRLPDTANWVHEQSLQVLKGLPAGLPAVEMSVRVVPGEGLL